jgi:hypothetical protein
LSQTSTNNWVATPAKKSAVSGLKLKMFSDMFSTGKIMTPKRTILKWRKKIMRPKRQFLIDESNQFVPNPK